MITLDREPPFSIWKTASDSPPSVWPVQETPRSYITIPPSNDPPASIVWAALRAEVPDEAGREPPEEFEALPVVVAAEVVTDDCVLVEETFVDAALVPEAFDVVVLACLGDDEAETVLLVELVAAASPTTSMSQSRPESAGAAVATMAKPKTAATRKIEDFMFEDALLGEQIMKA